MRKVLFLMFLLLLMGLGAASVRAQVRIGGNGAPNAAAVLDLNATDDATPAGNKGALALPRVSLANNTAQLNNTAPITGMLVYNTNATLGVGIYFWNGSKWIIISGDGVVGNELTDTIAAGGLTKIGAGTEASPWKVGIRHTPADSGKFLRWNGSAFDFVSPFGVASVQHVPVTPSTTTPVTFSVYSFPVVLQSPVLPGDYVQGDNPQILASHMCQTTQSYVNWLVTTSPGGVIMLNTTHTTEPAGISIWIRCYVPSV